MPNWILCVIFFGFGYVLNIFYITVLYHRGLTHGAVKLKPFCRILLIKTGNWITGLDPKSWACMHRLHHLYSDTPLDPHSPSHHGVFPLFFSQLRGYKRALIALEKKREPYTSLVIDLDFPVHWLNRKKLWHLPYLLHLCIAFILAACWQRPSLGIAYWMGIMSHPIQGWMVNAFGHRYGYTNFVTNDNSKNNTLVAWLVMGEGYQNNHHHQPQAAKFSCKYWEFDFGYALCLIAKWIGLIEIP